MLFAAQQSKMMNAEENQNDLFLPIFRDLTKQLKLKQELSEKVIYLIYDIFKTKHFNKWNTC